MALTAEYYDRFRPATPVERFFVDTLIDSNGASAASAPSKASSGSADPLRADG